MFEGVWTEPRETFSDAPRNEDSEDNVRVGYKLAARERCLTWLTNVRGQPKYQLRTCPKGA